MNYVSLSGRITKDLTLSYSTTGKAYLKFSIAVPKDNNRDEVDFINCTAWEKRAETIAQYFKKGSRILIQGKLTTSTYEKNGEKRNSVEVNINSFEFIDAKSTSSQSSNDIKSSYDDEKDVDFGQEDDDFPF